ncbi:unnamed protein product [Effrenium voratum]|uniref:Uncharacterized protein n=1 Tax=Effrenium voratum TaxID=2562239 RepID=A0AA36MGQ9_9DINO|nr:unnamed protein product [Effrenium voratum]
MLSGPSAVSQVQGKGDFRQNIFAVDMFGSARLALAVLLVSSASAQLASQLTKEQLKPLTVFRQQHRRLACWCSFCTFFLLAMMFAGGWPPVRGCFCAGVANRAFSLRAGLLLLGVKDKRVYTGCTDARPHAAQCC